MKDKYNSVIPYGVQYCKMLLDFIDRFKILSINVLNIDLDLIIPISSSYDYLGIREFEFLNSDETIQVKIILNRKDKSTRSDCYENSDYTFVVKNLK